MIERYKKAHAVGSSSGPPLLEHNAQVLIQTHASYIYLTVSHSKIRWSFDDIYNYFFIHVLKPTMVTVWN